MIARPFYYTTLGADPTNADVVYVGAETFYKSTDGGKTFAAMRDAARRQSRHLDQSERRQHHDPVERRRRERVVRRRAHVVDADEPADRRDLRRVARRRSSRIELYGAQQDAATVIVPSFSDAGTDRAVRSGPGLRDGPDHAAPEESDTSSTARARGSSAA